MRIFRVRCERCGTETTSPLYSDVSVRLYRNIEGGEMWMDLCPECKAEWERMLSNFLQPTIGEQMERLGLGLG